MVYLASKTPETLRNPMATETPRPLHSFSIPLYKWRDQCLLPPSVTVASGRRSSSRRPSHSHPPPPPPPTDPSIEQARAKILDHLHNAADHLNYKLPHQPPPPPPPPADSSPPWNLRSKKASHRPPPPAVADSPPPPPSASPPEKAERKRFSISLTRDELEEDFFVITGAKLPRRPKRRPKTIQRQLDAIFPGLWLADITPDTYKVSNHTKR